MDILDIEIGKLAYAIEKKVEELIEYYKMQGKSISKATIYKRINEYYKEKEIDKPEKQKGKKEKKQKESNQRKNGIDIPTEEIVKLYYEKQKSAEEIVEYYKEQGKSISKATIYNRINGYYKEKGMEKPKKQKGKKEKKQKESNQREKRSNISTEEIIELYYEKKKTINKIVEYYQKQGISISGKTIYRRIDEYYKEKGMEKPKKQKSKKEKKQKESNQRKNGIDIPTEEIVDLYYEKQKSAEEIVEHYKKQGKSISKVTIYRKINKYYKEKGMEKPKKARKQTVSKPRKKRSNISTEEIVDLYSEKQKTVEEIVEHYKEQGKSISKATIYSRIDEYYKEKGIDKPKKSRKQKSSNQSKKKPEISTEEIIRLYYDEQKTPKEIVEHYKKQGKSISPATIYNRINKYYKEKGIDKPKRRINITPEEVGETYKKVKTKKGVSDYYKKQGKNISVLTVSNRLAEYHKQSEISMNSELDDELKKILMTGSTINQWKANEEDKSKIERMYERLRRLRIIAEHSIKTEDGYIPDEKFLAIINILENQQINNPVKGYATYLRNLGIGIGSVCKEGKINTIRYRIFDGNNDLTSYMLSGMCLIFEGYDSKLWNSINKKYKEKIEKYFNRLHMVEQKRNENAQKNKKIPDSQLFQGEER